MIAATVATLTLASACSSSGDEDGGGDVDDESVDPGTDSVETAEATSDDASAEADPAPEEANEAPEEAETADPSTADEPTPAELQTLLSDAQALCDALDQEEIRAIAGDFVELRPDDLFQDDRNLCQAFGDRFAVAGVWVYADASEQQELHEFAARPFEECQVNGYDALCQTHTGSEDSFNGWPTVSIRVGSAAVEVDAPDPAVAQELAAAVLDDLGAAALN